MPRRPGTLQRILKRLNIALHVALKTIIFCFACHATISVVGNSDGFGRRTPIAHRDSIVLADGSLIDINANSLVFLRDGPHRRQIFVPDGEILATVRHNETKPLTIVFNHAVITDIGTRLDVSVHGSTANVSVTEGELRITNRLDDGSQLDPMIVTASGSRRGKVILHKGDSARLEEQAGTLFVTFSPNDLTSAQNRTSWTQGKFVSFGQPLDETALQFNRYTTTPLVIEDPQIASQRFGGTYDLTKIDALVLGLRRLGYDITSIQDERGELQAYVLGSAPNASSSRTQSPHKPNRLCPCRR